MTGVEIKQQAENYLDEAVDDVEALTAINRALNLIGDMALIYATVTAEITEADRWYKLPEDLTNVREVEDECGRTYEGYRVRDNLIAFDAPGKYTVHYRRLPRPISGILDTPEVHPAWHQVLVTYVIAWWKLKDDDENPDGLRHLQQFQEDALRVFNTLRRARGPRQVKVYRHA